MVTVIVQFGLAGISLEKARVMFTESSQRFVNMPGLLRKYFLLTEYGSSAGSVYLWETRQAAQAFFTEEWMEFITKKYGYRPIVTVYECPLVVDNITGEIIHAG